MKDLVSIIIPVYNREAYVKECVASVQGQTYGNFEILLIDDGSADRTPQICEELAKADQRIRLLLQDHGGVSAARNRGLEAANGEFLFFLDSDDVIHANLLEALVNGLQTTDAGMAATEVVNVPQKYWYMVEDRLKEPAPKGSADYRTHEEAVHAVFHGISPLNLIGGVMMRRELVGQNRFRTDLFIAEDFYFMYENLIQGASAVFLKEKWYYCRLHEGNSSNNLTFAAFYSRFRRRELVWEQEMRLGRTENADLQKREATGIFVNCIKRNPVDSEESQKMRQFIKKYEKVLLPALTVKGRIYYYLSAYAPRLFFVIFGIKDKLRRRHR